MKILKYLYRKDTGNIDQIRLKNLLILVMLSLCLVSCKTLKTEEEKDVTDPKIIIDGDVTYWCVEKNDFTALLQEADRCR